MPRHYEDFTGKEINGILVKEIIIDSGGEGKHKKWKCECTKCKKEFIAQSNRIKTRKTYYCEECSKTDKEDLTGKRFNHLIVDYMIKTNKRQRSKCSCTCDCGTTGVIVQCNHLKEGSTKSCGCILSYPEEEIASILTENNISFEKQKSFPDLKYVNPLRCDFYLPDMNLIIEYNGKQHYEPIDYYGGIENYSKTIARDKAKRDYCIINNIGYVVIRYNEDILEALIKNNIIMKR